MGKPIIATNIDGLILEHDVFYEPHRDWFKRAIEKTKDNSLEKWVGREDYFLGVNEAMKKIMPDATKEEQTKKAREWYQEDVIKYIKNNPDKIKKENIKKLESLKEKYTLILITTNSKDYIDEILKASKVKNIYEGIIANKTEEEPSKEKLIEEIKEKYGIPEIYLTGKPEEKITNKFQEIGTEIKTINEI
jgi:phosphoglycolate phosphatase-like HAD superfamily hydrolase